MNKTKISCILALSAIAIFIITVTFSKQKGWESLDDLKWVLPLWIVMVIIALIGFGFSISAIIKEKTVLSWICFIVYLLPPLFIFLINPVVENFQYKARKAAQYDSPQSQEKREKMYGKYDLPDSLDISKKNQFASADILDDHYPIISVFNCGNGLWYFSSQEAAAGFGGHKGITSLATIIDIDKSVVPLLTTLPAKHYATRKDAKSSWITGEYNMPARRK